MRTIRLLATSLLVALSMGVNSCGDFVTNEIIQQETAYEEIDTIDKCYSI